MCRSEKNSRQGEAGGSYLIVRSRNVHIEPFNPRKRWRKVQDLISRVWSRWLKEYLPTLSTRSKWNEVVKDLKEGDVVLVMEKDLPRGRWPLARIVQNSAGEDSLRGQNSHATYS